MSHPEVVTSSVRLEIRSPMRAGLRVVLAVMGAVPLLAPYELLVRPGWQRVADPFFAFAALVSAGAVAVSCLFLAAAVAGTSSRIVVDRRAGTVAFTSQAPVVRRSTRVYALRDVVAVEVGVQDWSDGDPAHHVRLAMVDGTVLRTGSSTSCAEVEAIRARLASFLAEGFAEGEDAPP